MQCGTPALSSVYGNSRLDFRAWGVLCGVSMRAFLLIMMLSAFSASAFAGDVVTGRARIIDGDTVMVAGKRVRLQALDAPEIDQQCQGVDGRPWFAGRSAKWWLIRHVAKRELSCDLRQWDAKRGRWNGVCRVDGEDLGHALVSQGWAFAWKRYGDDYVADEQGAQRRQLGVWRGRCEKPWEWRWGSH